MDKELKVTEERVRDAAASCSTAKQVLEKLFPEVFEKKCLMVQGGTRLKRENGDEYIVASIDSGRAAIIGLDDGNRWNNPVDVDVQQKKVPLKDLLRNPDEHKQWHLA